jgi:hypothetical protein
VFKKNVGRRALPNRTSWATPSGERTRWVSFLALSLDPPGRIQAVGRRATGRSSDQQRAACW